MIKILENWFESTRQLCLTYTSILRNRNDSYLVKKNCVKVSPTISKKKHLNDNNDNARQHMCTIMANETFNINYYQSDLLWKLWLVESIQPIYNRMWSWHDNSISAAVIIMGVLFKRLFKICIIKKLLNSVFVWYHKLSNLESVLSVTAFGFSR